MPSDLFPGFRKQAAHNGIDVGTPLASRVSSLSFSHVTSTHVEQIATTTRRFHGESHPRRAYEACA